MQRKEEKKPFAHFIESLDDQKTIQFQYDLFISFGKDQFGRNKRRKKNNTFH